MKNTKSKLLKWYDNYIKRYIYLLDIKIFKYQYTIYYNTIDKKVYYKKAYNHKLYISAKTIVLYSA